MNQFLFGLCGCQTGKEPPQALPHLIRGLPSAPQVLVDSLKEKCHEFYALCFDRIVGCKYDSVALYLLELPFFLVWCGRIWSFFNSFWQGRNYFLHKKVPSSLHSSKHLTGVYLDVFSLCGWIASSSAEHNRLDDSVHKSRPEFSPAVRADWQVSHFPWSDFTSCWV